MRITRRQLRKMIAECMSEDPGMYMQANPMEDMAMRDAESDHEGRELGDGGSASMARGQLFTTAQKAQSLYDRLSDEDELPEWIQYKITMASDYISTAEEYLSYRMHRYDSGDPIPAYESRTARGHRLFEAEEEATTGRAAKGGAVVDKAKKLLDRVPGLESVLKQVDTKDKLTALVQAIVDSSIETGGLDQAEVNSALSNAASAAKKG